jgi:hypothetical protein
MNSTPEPRHEQAVQRCQEMIAWYDKTKVTQRELYRWSQILAVVLSGLTPILILWNELPKPLQALPAALAAIVTALNGIFQWKDNYTRFAYTGEALKSELFKFQTRTTVDYARDVDDQQALENFVYRIEQLRENEVTDWRAQFQRASQPAKVES